VAKAPFPSLRVEPSSTAGMVALVVRAFVELITELQEKVVESPY